MGLNTFGTDKWVRSLCCLLKTVHCISKETQAPPHNRQGLKNLAFASPWATFIPAHCPSSTLPLCPLDMLLPLAVLTMLTPSLFIRLAPSCHSFLPPLRENCPDHPNERSPFPKLLSPYFRVFIFNLNKFKFLFFHLQCPAGKDIYSTYYSVVNICPHLYILYYVQGDYVMYYPNWDTLESESY